jgi:hypothetical protein
MSTEYASRGYVFGPLEKRGTLAGLRTGQLIMIGSAFIVALIVMDALPASLSLPIALAVIAGMAGLAFVSPGGRGLDEWIPLMIHWFVSLFKGTNKWFSTLPLLGDPRTDGTRVDLEDDPRKKKHSPQNNKNDKNAKKGKGGKNGEGDGSGPQIKSGPTRKQMASMPPPLRNLVILEVPVGDGSGTVGVIKDTKNGLYTAVLAVRGDAFALLESNEKERRLQAWADVLGGLARPGSFVHRVQWIERAVPDDGDALNRYLAEARVQPMSTPTVRSYVDLLEEFGPVSQQHETFIAIQISAVKSGRIVKKAGGGDKGASIVLIRELRQLADTLISADIHVDGALSPRLLALTFRNAVDPHNRRALVKKGRQDPERAGVAPANAWPVATEVKWDYYRTEDVFHTTYWISEWPRVEVGPDFIAPLMIRTQRIRTVSLVMQPIDPGKAQKEVESAHTAYLSDNELRSRAGYITSERRRRELEGVLRREQELADGFAEFRFAGYVTVTASTLDEMDEACNEIEQIATQSRLELRKLYGEQDAAFACTLPLCRGLRDK